MRPSVLKYRSVGREVPKRSKPKAARYRVVFLYVIVSSERKTILSCKKFCSNKVYKVYIYIRPGKTYLQNTVTCKKWKPRTRLYGGERPNAIKEFTQIKIGRLWDEEYFVLQTGEQIVQRALSWLLSIHCANIFYQLYVIAIIYDYYFIVVLLL